MKRKGEGEGSGRVGSGDVRCAVGRGEWVREVNKNGVGINGIGALMEWERKRSGQ